MKHYDLAVIIGRFQPIHKGHMGLFRRAEELADTTVCIVGSIDKPSTPKNPFSYDERRELIEAALKEEGLTKNKVFMSGVRDSFYCDQKWFGKVRDEVSYYAGIAKQARIEYTQEEMARISDELEFMVGSTDWGTYIELHGSHNDAGRKIKEYWKLSDELTKSRIAVLGYEKDESSFYLRHFADWTFINVEPDYKYNHQIDATVVRDLWLTDKFGYAIGQLHANTIKFMMEYDSNAYEVLKEDYKHITDYRKATQLGPFPVQFLTTDAVVIHGDEILLIRRGVAPGKGQWALPGGFKDWKETFFDSCVRELREETRIALPEKVIRGSLKDEHMFDYPNRSSRGTTVSMAYLFVLDPTQPRPRIKGGDDAVDAWWFPLADVERMRDQIFEDHADIIEYMTARL